MSLSSFITWITWWCDDDDDDEHTIGELQKKKTFLFSLTLDLVQGEGKTSRFYRLI